MNGPTLWRRARLATLAGSAPWGLIERGALLVDGDRIAWVGAEADLDGDRLDADVHRRAHRRTGSRRRRGF